MSRARSTCPRGGGLREGGQLPRQHQLLFPQPLLQNPGSFQAHLNNVQWRNYQLEKEKKDRAALHKNSSCIVSLFRGGRWALLHPYHTLPHTVREQQQCEDPGRPGDYEKQKLQLEEHAQVSHAMCKGNVCLFVFSAG